MLFPVRTSELRNPNVQVPAPEGQSEQPGVTWIYITFARPQPPGQPMNRFFTDTFTEQFTKFMDLLIQEMQKRPRLKYRKGRTK